MMPDVPITLTNVATAASAGARTDASGAFTFSDLPAGDYELTASRSGFADGFVKGITPVGVAPADAAFAQAAMAAVSQWRFTPMRLDGVAIETHMNVSITFSPQ